MSTEDEAPRRSHALLRAIREEVASAAEEARAVMERVVEGPPLGDLDTEISEVLRNLQELRGSLTDATEKSSQLLGAAEARLGARGAQQARQAFWEQLVGVSKEAVGTVEEGYRGVHNTIDTLESARGAMSVASDRRAALSELVSGVGDFLSLISHINKRTNLLALNASIAAAQAGEHGRAFMIIAREVKTLADKTSESTLEIEESMGAILKENDAVAEAIGDTSTALDSGYKAASDAGDTLVELRKRIARLARRAQSDALAAANSGNEEESGHDLHRLHAATVDALNDWTMAADRLGAVHRMVVANKREGYERELEGRVRRLMERLDRIELRTSELGRLSSYED